MAELAAVRQHNAICDDFGRCRTTHGTKEVHARILKLEKGKVDLDEGGFGDKGDVAPVLGISVGDGRMKCRERGGRSCELRGQRCRSVEARE